MSVVVVVTAALVLLSRERGAVFAMGGTDADLRHASPNEKCRVTTFATGCRTFCEGFSGPQVDREEGCSRGLQ
jgi:hypothetical protein